MIRASCDRVFAYLAHPEHLPRFGAPLWMAADAVEKRGNTHVVALRGYFIGLPVESVQRAVLRPPSSVGLSQIRGTLRAFSGRFTLQSVEEGSEILYRVEADLGIPMITEDAARQFLVQYVERLLDRIKLAAERKAPARRVRAAAAAPPAGADVPVEATASDEETEDAPESRGGSPARAGPVSGSARAAPPEDASAAIAAAQTNLGEPGRPRAPQGPQGLDRNASSPGRRRRRRRRRRRPEAGGTTGLR